MNSCEPHPIGHYLWSRVSPSFLGGPVASNGMAFFRPNQAINRGIYRAYSLGQDSSASTAFGLNIDPTLLLAGVGLLGIAALMFGGKKAKQTVRRTRVRRLRRKLAALEAT